jgi:hypothetical protein
VLAWATEGWVILICTKIHFMGCSARRTERRNRKVHEDFEHALIKSLQRRNAPIK